VSPAPAANTPAAAGATQDRMSATNNPGTATAPSGIAARFATTPMGATVPNAYAVIGAVTSVAAAPDPSARSNAGRPSSARPAQITPPTAATDSHAPTLRSAQGSSASSTSTVSPMDPRGATARWRSRPRSSRTSITAARTAGAGAPRSHMYRAIVAVPTPDRAPGESGSRRNSSASHPAMKPTWRPEIDNRCARPERANRSRSSGLISARRASTRASTSDARLPNNAALRRATAPRQAPRPRGTGSTSRTWRPASTPRSAVPSQRPAAIHSVPPVAGRPGGQRTRSPPPHGPRTTIASTTPPSAPTLSSNRTRAARVSRAAPGARLAPSHTPAQVCDRTIRAPDPQSTPASAATAHAAATGARRTHNPVPATRKSAGQKTGYAPRPAHRPAASPAAIHRMGGRRGRPQRLRRAGRATPRSAAPRLHGGTR
jgi:hypothetical protein